MEPIDKIEEILSANKYLIFYKIMKYPIPASMEYFFFEKKTNTNIKNKLGFSRNKKNEFIDEFIEFIDKYGKIYRSIPFIKEIYLCNSISFNALKKNSDIDLFIITKKNSIRRARFFSVLFFYILGLKRGKTIRKKFCLSFYVTEDNQNLYRINLPRSDIYLNYWLAHLVPLYQEQLNSSNIYKDNKRFKINMPNHPQRFCINIGNKKHHGKSKFKKRLEFIFGGILGEAIEMIISLIWKPILSTKIKKLGKKGQGIIIKNNILKFHYDKRFQIRLMYEIENKNSR